MVSLDCLAQCAPPPAPPSLLHPCRLRGGLPPRCPHRPAQHRGSQETPAGGWAREQRLTQGEGEPAHGARGPDSASLGQPQGQAPENTELWGSLACRCSHPRPGSPVCSLWVLEPRGAPSRLLAQPLCCRVAHVGGSASGARAKPGRAVWEPALSSALPHPVPASPSSAPTSLPAVGTGIIKSPSTGRQRHDGTVTGQQTLRSEHTCLVPPASHQVGQSLLPQKVC